jgi:serine/threonine protein kinase
MKSSAFDDVQQEKVAIKKLINVFDRQELMKRTLRELRALRNLKHNNVRGVHICEMF